MVKDDIIYETITGSPDLELLGKLEALYDDLFDDARLEFFRNRLNENLDLIVVTANRSETLIGFKIGYQYDQNTFYSWLGGVDRNYRKQGIASQLAKLQETCVREKGYKKIRTKSMNRFKPMMSLNLKNGFDIINVYTNDKGQTKIVFEKSLS